MRGEREPALKNYYILTWDGGGGMGARVQDQSRVKELEKIINEEIFADLPDLVVRLPPRATCSAALAASAW